MPTDDLHPPTPEIAGILAASDILSILREQNWLACDPTPEINAWCEHAAALLGHSFSDRAALTELLGLVFSYDAAQILQSPDSHSVIARVGAREVIRHLAFFLLDPAPLSTDRFREIIEFLKTNIGLRSRDLFHPLRLALTGRAGEGDLDRIILLLDEAATLPFVVPVKSARTRILEFCAALD
jgi:nondiscriminating glutamyl-tRNA synthetase